MSGFRSVMEGLVRTFGPAAEKLVSEPSVSSRNSESVCIGQTQTTASGVSNVLVYILLQVNHHYLFLGILIITQVYLRFEHKGHILWGHQTYY